MSKHFVYDTALNNMIGKPSGYRISPWSVMETSAKYAGKGVKFVGYDVPKLLLYDAAWGGLVEGLGLREPRDMKMPWENSEEEPAESVEIKTPVKTSPSKSKIFGIC
jgi:hypothetical protein